MGIYIKMYIYIYIYIESWPEWDSNPRPRTYRAHALNHCAIWPYDQMCLMVYRIK